MRRPRCSVVIPCYNGRRTLRRAIDSVLAQTTSEFELLVVDDGSVEGSAAAARGCRDRRLRLIAQRHSGATAARDRGLREARGEWVGFLDADDEWRPRFLERTLDLAGSRPPLSAVFTNLLAARDREPWLRLPFTRPWVIDDYLQFAIDNEGRGMTSSSTLVRREALLGPSGVAAGGLAGAEGWLRLALAGPMGCVPEVLSVYHNEPSPERPEPDRGGHLARVRALRRLLRAGGLTAERRDRVRRLEALYLLQHAQELIARGRPARARRLLRRDGSPARARTRRWLRAVRERLGR